MALHEKIHLRNVYEKNACAYYPILVIGAGASGIAMGCQLQRQWSFSHFRILERQSGIGGK